MEQIRTCREYAILWRIRPFLSFYYSDLTQTNGILLRFYSDICTKKWRVELQLTVVQGHPKNDDAQCAQFFIRAHFSKNTGERRALFGKNTGKKFLWFYRLLWFSIQSVIDLTWHSSITLWTSTESPKYGQNHTNTGVIRAIFHKCPYIRACPYLYGRLGHTGYMFTNKSMFTWALGMAQIFHRNRDPPFSLMGRHLQQQCFISLVSNLK